MIITNQSVTKSRILEISGRLRIAASVVINLREQGKDSIGENNIDFRRGNPAHS